MRTIPRNHTKKVEAVFASATSARVYRLDDGFEGRDVDARYAREALTNGGHARLVVDDHRATVYVHSNLWYEMTLSEDAVAR